MRNILNRFLPVFAPEDEAGTAGGDAPAPDSTLPADPAPAEAPKADEAGLPEAPAETPPAEEIPLFTAEDIKVPDGLSLDPEQTERALALINDTAMSPKDRGEALVKFYEDSAVKLYEGVQKAAVAQFESWRADLEKDTTLGGGNLPATETAIAGVIEEFAPQGLTDLFNQTGIGNHKLFVQFLVNVAKVTGEGKPAVGAPTSSKRTAAEILFPTEGKV